MHLKEEALQEMQSNMDTPGNCANWIVSWNGFCHVYGSLSDGRGGWGGWECPYNQCVNLNLTVFVQGKKKKKIKREIITEITVSLSLSSSCAVYCRLADGLSARVFVRAAWVGAELKGFFAVVKRRSRMRGDQDQYLPLQLRCT